MRYDIKLDEFEKIACLNKKRYGLTLCEFNNTYLYAFGGQRVTNEEYSHFSFERIRFCDMTKQALWEDIEYDVGILEPTNYLACIPINNQEIMIFGGQKSKLKFDDVYIYDAELNVLIKEYDSPLKRADFFEMRSFIYTKNKQKFIIAGAYYIHEFDIKERKWEILDKSILHKYMPVHKLQTAKTMQYKHNYDTL